MKLDPQQLEENIRKAIAATPGINDISDREYCEIVLEALDSVRSEIPAPSEVNRAKFNRRR